MSGDHDRQRLTTTWRIVLVGGILAVAAAVGVALLGGSGATGLGVLLVVCAFATAVAGLQALTVGFIDDVRRRPVSRRRVLTALALLALSLVLLVMAGGALGSQ